MNIKVLRDKLESLEIKLRLTDDYTECQILESQIELLETLLEAHSL